MPIDDYTWDTHMSGVHVNCRKPWSGQYEDHPRRCRYAGKVERVHSHDFDGTLVCGCVDFVN